MRRIAAALGPQRTQLHKRREILFSRFPPGQVPEAADILGGLPRLKVEHPGVQERLLFVEYDLTDYTLRGLEEGLIDQGFRLDNSLMSKLVRAIVYYSEDIQLHNLDAPERLTKRPDNVYVRAWEHHPHGDHDDTPPDLRDQQ